jgi:hypothetical protein
LRFGDSIPAKLLSAGSAMLLVCGMGSAQNTHQPVGANRAHQSSARLQTVSSISASRSNFIKIRKSRRKASSRQRGQQKIDAARSREIQEALMREHYLDGGSASGVWDSKSQSAMERYQADNGWQSKTVPDSRALIKLGLGPDHEHLLNPESAMTSRPDTPRVSPLLNQTPTVAAPPQK